MVSRLTAIPSGPNAFSKESRDAALRERGLLPPLRANKDLSAQEKEQDKAIPIVSPKDDPGQRGSTEANTPSAADLIKKEWEAKNRLLESAQLQRMNSFKFGGTSSPIDSPVIPKEFSSEFVDSAVPDVQVLPACQPLSSSPVDVAYLPPPSSADSPVTPGTEPDSRPVTPLLDISPEIVAYLFPLPPSTPRSVLKKLDLSPLPSPTSVPLPPSPASRVFDTTSLRSASGARTPGPLNSQEASLTPTPTPIIAFTPCAAISPELISADDATNHKSTDLSVPLDESASSTHTPSLDSNSHTTTIDSIPGTSESVAVSGKGRLGGLKIATHEGSNYNIPVIVESPIEDNFLEEQFLVVGPTSTLGHDQVPPTTAPINGSEPLSSPRMKKRVLTDPTNGDMNRNKSIIMNPFKRGLNEDHSTTIPGERPRRLSIKRSLSNMHRSVTSSLSRKSVSPDGKRKMFDASHLPPSPVFPLSFRSLHSPRSPTSPGFKTEGEMRRAVSPTVYSHGHILMEASYIEDEESRRVTEMAFLT